MNQQVMQKSSGQFRPIQAESGIDGRPMGAHGQSGFAHGWAEKSLPMMGRPWMGNGQPAFAHGPPMSMSKDRRY